MIDSPRIIQSLLKEVLETQFFMALATRGTSRLHASLLAFAASSDLTEIVFATARASRKFINLSAYENVAILIDNRSNDPADINNALSITAYGEANEATKDKRERMLELYSRKQPALAAFASSPASALVCVRIKEYDIVSEFQKVTRFIPSPGQSTGIICDESAASFSQDGDSNG
jgi:heme iron utilization protein